MVFHCGFRPEPSWFCPLNGGAHGVSVFRVCASIAINDSLQNGTANFLAESTLRCRAPIPSSPWNLPDRRVQSRGEHDRSLRSRAWQRPPIYGPESFTYLLESNSCCPAGQQSNYGGRNEENRTFGYIGTRKEYGPCQQRSQRTTGSFRHLAIHMNDAARQRARDLPTTEGFKYAQQQRKTSKRSSHN